MHQQFLWGPGLLITPVLHEASVPRRYAGASASVPVPTNLFSLPGTLYLLFIPNPFPAPVAVGLEDSGPGSKIN